MLRPLHRATTGLETSGNLTAVREISSGKLSNVSIAYFKFGATWLFSALLQLYIAFCKIFLISNFQTFLGAMVSWTKKTCLSTTWQ